MISRELFSRDVLKSEQIHDGGAINCSINCSNRHIKKRLWDLARSQGAIDLDPSAVSAKKKKRSSLHVFHIGPQNSHRCRDRDRP